MKVLALTLVAAVVLASGGSCSGGSGGKAETTGANGTLIVSSKSDQGLNGYTRWTTGWNGKPAGDLVEIGPGEASKVAGFCVPKGYQAKGKVTNSFDFTTDITVRSGDCKKVNHLERYSLMVTEQG